MTSVRAVRLDHTDRFDDAAGDLDWHGWPRFMHATAVGDAHWGRLYRDFRGTQAVLLDGDDVVASVHAIGVRWDGTAADLPAHGWDEAFVRAVEGHEAGVAPTALCALAIVVRPDRRGQGLAPRAVAELRAMAADAGLDAVIACVRPNHKARYPLTPIANYARWTDAEGAPFDPWMRVHWRAGAETAAPVEQSMLIQATTTEWEEWTGLRFPESGRYVVPEALVPVEIDVERGLGTYREPNVWMVHRLTGTGVRMPLG